MTGAHSFQCGTCNLIEPGISANEVMELSTLHFSGKHIDVDELRKLKKKRRCAKSSLNVGGKNGI